MTKSELIEKVAKKSYLTKRSTRDAVDNLFNIISEVLVRGEKVIISGFGTFLLRSRSARRGRNPQTGETMQIPQKKTPGFTAGKTLKRQVR